MGYFIFLIRSLFRYLGNGLRRILPPVDYVVFVLEGKYPQLRSPKVTWWQKRLTPPKLSLEELNQQLQTVAADKRAKGVVLHLRNLALPMAGLQALRASLAALQARGKKVVVWTASLNTASYYVACQADRILLQPGGRITPLGLTHSSMYMAKSLAHLGLQMDAVKISPFKSAADRLTRTSMSDEVRSMQNWLLDSNYQQLIEAISKGRKVARERAETLIDHSPYTDQQAVEQGLVDGINNEEELPALLGEKGKPARLIKWRQGRRRLSLPSLAPPGSYIALLRIQGNIVDGKSTRPPSPLPLPVPFLFSPRAGDLTVVSLARKILRDPSAKGLLVYVDSGGGSATASEAIYSALAKVATKKPVVAMMGSVAASGGYYVSAPAHWIVAQPGTITGSIGVLTGKLVDRGLLDKLLMNRETLNRGDNAAMESSEAPFTPRQREKVHAFINNIYQLFLRRVAEHRNLPTAAVDKVGGGRVWTGAQAKEHGLVDELGGLEQALAKLRELGKLGPQVPLKEIPLPKAAAAGSAPLVHAMANIHLLQTCDALCLCPLEFH